LCPTGVQLCVLLLCCQNSCRSPLQGMQDEVIDIAHGKKLLELCKQPVGELSSCHLMPSRGWLCHRIEQIHLAQLCIVACSNVLV
jgi:hypothetical protein